MKKIFLFPLNYKHKTEFLLQEIEKLNILNEFTYISSNFCKVQDFKLKFYNKFKNHILPETFTLKSFAIKIINENSPKKIISEIEKYLILLELVKNKKKGNLLYQDEGFTKVVLNFIREIKISFEKIEISKIKKEINDFSWKFENNKKNVEFALNVFEEYENYLEKKNFIDNENIYKEAVKYIKNYSIRNLVFENILEFPMYQKIFISELIKSSKIVLISFFEPENFSPDAQELIVKDTLKFLNSIEEFKIEKVKGETYQPQIECFNFPTKEEEIKGLIYLINREMTNNGITNLDDFMITCPDMLNYRNYIKRIFLRFNIPIEVIPGYSFILEPSIYPIFEFVTLSETYDWNVLMNILTSPYFTAIDRELVSKFSEISREKFENTGFYRDDFENIDDKNIKKIKECLNLFEKNGITLSEWSKIIEKIIEKMGWDPYKIEIKQDFEKIIKNLKGSYFVNKKEFINLMKKIFEMIEIEKGEGYGIKVSGIIESLGIEKKICFFCGATEKNFPNSSKTEEFLLPDKIKKDLGLEYFEKRIARDRADFYRIKNEHEKIIFTYPTKIEDKLQMKSLFIFDIESKSTPLPNIYYFNNNELFKIKIQLEKFKEKYVKNNKLVIEVTELEALLKCPYKFYLKKIEKIKPYKVPKVREIPDLWGKIIHNCFEKTFTNKKNKPIEKENVNEYKIIFESLIHQEIENYYKENKISSIYRKIIELRVKEVLNKFEEVISGFSGNIFLSFEEKKEFENEKILLKGRIDIIGKTPKEEFIVIDIKTGTSGLHSYREEDFKIKYNIQLPLYVWIYSKLNGLNYKDVKGEIWNFSFLEDTKTIKKYDFSKNNFKYMEKIEEFLNKISEDIIENRFSFIPDVKKCDYFCEYQEGCIYKNEK